MSLLSRTSPILLAAVAAVPSPVLGQERPADRFAAAALTREATNVTVQPPESFGPAADQGAKHGVFSLNRVLHTLGGALVGGWVGYVGAQVALSDWEKETNSSFRDQRLRWVAGGMAVGMVGSWVIGGTRSPRPALPASPRGPGVDRTRIARAEIAGSDAADAYELVASLRPEWLRSRGVQSWAESTRGTADEDGAVVQPGRDRILVYMDDRRLGGVDELRSIAPSDLDHLEFIGPREATYRYGSGHTHGVILLSTAPGA